MNRRPRPRRLFRHDTATDAERLPREEFCDRVAEDLDAHLQQQGRLFAYDQRGNRYLVNITVTIQRIVE